MTPEQKARAELVATLRELSDSTQTVVGSLFAQAANEIEDLADKLDFRMADELSTAVMDAMRETVKRVTGYEAGHAPFYVSNVGFSGEIIDPSPGGYTWKIACQRKEHEDVGRSTLGE